MTDRWGIDEGYWSSDGEWRDVPAEALEALRAELGDPDEGEPWWFVTEGRPDRLLGPCTVALEEGGEVHATDALPPDLPLGVHTLRPDDGGPDTVLVIHPERTSRPARCWGVSVQVPGLRSERSGNHGTLADLADLGEWVRGRGGAFVAHNPLGAPSPGGEDQPSPYFPSSRRWWSPLYLDLARLPGRELAAAEVAAAERALAMHRDRVDRAAAWATLAPALEAVWERVAGDEEVQRAVDTHPDHEDLMHFARFGALAEVHGPDWRRWPTELHEAGGEAVRRACAPLAGRVRFRAWVQVVLDGQLDDTAAGIDLVSDLPVGFDPGGADAWADRALLSLGCRIGAPPDTFEPSGQDWGLPPYHPGRLRAARYEPVRAAVRRAARHAAALRVDHVMGLFRLYWIPPGHGPRDGAYVRFPGRELFEVVVMEAARAGVVLLGEDLGTVEPEVREAMTERGAFGYRVGWFEPDRPERWPAATLGSLSTHDLPTVAGIWTGTDLSDREAAGRTTDDRTLDQEAELRGRLAGIAGISNEGVPGSATGTPATGTPVDEVVVGAHRTLGAAGSDLVVAQLEDLLGVEHRPNLPGTVDEHPNWRHAMPCRIGDLNDHPLAGRVTDALTTARPPT